MREKEQKKLMGTHALILLIFIIIVVAGAAFYGVYQITMDIIVNSNIENMKELAEHDKLNVQTSIDDKEQMVYNWAYTMRLKKYAQISDLQEELMSGSDILGSDALYLVDDELNFYSSNGVIRKKEYYEEFLDDFGENNSFMIRYDTYEYEKIAESRGEGLVIFTKIKEFSVDGHAFQYAVAELPLSIFQEEIKIDSYDGLGFCNIIDRDGYYVVNVDSKSLQIRDNFFDRYRDCKIKGYDSIEGFIDAVHDKEDSSLVTRVSKDDKKYIIVASTMEGENWTFVTLCEATAFSSLGNRITAVFTALVAVMMIALSLVIIMTIRNKNARINIEMEKQHKEELADALIQAQAANKSKTTFLNNISHDIRTPMNAIIGFTALATTHVEDPGAVKGYLAKIAKSSEHLLSLINDVLDMSRIESGKVNIHEKEENLSEILHSLRDIVQADITAKQMNFYMDTVDVSDEMIICDKLRVNQILLNIISNSLKYTPTGGTISVRVMQKEVKPSGYVAYEFRIKDNGIGMTEEFVKTIFEPFTRAETTTISGVQGTGLGMTITKNIVEMMGGRILVESRLHEGTEFIVSLDFKLAAEHKEVEKIEKLNGLRSLVVDDDMNACQSVSDMLRDVGMRAEWCTFGREAVVRTQEAVRIGDKFAVYVIDWLMPDMNGIETTRRIRKAVGEDSPIIIMTAYDYKDIEEEAYAAGVTRFVSKPLFPSDLHRVLMEACGEAVEEEAPVKIKTDFSGKRILLAEDNELNREIAIEILEESGFEIESAEDGQVCCDMVAASSPGYYDLILMDIQMPVMDGYEATRTIRRFENKELAEIPIIAMTANAFQEDKQHAADAGMNGHIAKPLDIPVLISTLEEILGKGES